MGKPPPSDAQLEQRVEQLEQRADATDAALEAIDADIADLEARVTALEAAATAPAPEPPDGTWGGVAPPLIDNTLPTPEPQPPEIPEPPVVGGLSATYVVPSGPRAGSYVYSEAGGDGQTVTVLDDYADPDGDFVMTCIAVTRDDAPLQVIFRQVPGWQSVIFECCDALATANQHMMPDSGDTNTVIVSDSGIAIETVTLWGQWALGRWRWQSGPWPYPKDPAVLRAKRWLPWHDGAALGPEPPAPGHVEYAPMHLPAGSPLYVPGGGNPLMLSAVQGYWSAHPTAESLANMLRHAEGVGAYPWFIRDSTTWAVPNVWQGALASTTAWMPNSGYSVCDIEVSGMPGTAFGSNTITDENGQLWGLMWQPYCIVDTNGYLAATMQNQGYPGASLPSGPLIIDNPDIHTITIKAQPNFMQGSGLVIDEAHSGSMWPYPWLATGDPYYLEALHAKYAMVWWTVGRPVPRASLAYSQIRQTAWQLTSLLLAAATTPEVTPSWLLPKSLWTTLWADEMRLWDAELVHGTSGGATVFHTVGATAGGAQGGYSLATWQEDMILMVMAWAAMLLPESVRCAEWKVIDQIARTNGTSGWCQFYPEGYYVDIGPVDRSRFYADWSEAWRENQAAQKVVGPPDPTTLASSGDYTLSLRGALAFAAQAGIEGATEALTWLEGQMRAVGYGGDWPRLWSAQPFS